VTENPTDDRASNDSHSAGRVLVVALAVFTALAVVAAIAFRPSVPPPEVDIAGDALLTKGYELYQMRCVSCHGARGKGDGPIAKAIVQPRPGDLTDRTWKHGDQPDKVLQVIAQGVPGTQMAGWASAFSQRELKAVAGYCFHLGGRPVPEAYREGWVPDPTPVPDEEPGG
jgi:cytochrome c oxidase cbb3-type subunit 3